MWPVTAIRLAIEKQRVARHFFEDLRPAFGRAVDFPVDQQFARVGAGLQRTPGDAKDTGSVGLTRDCLLLAGEGVVQMAPLQERAVRGGGVTVLLHDPHGFQEVCRRAGVVDGQSRFHDCQAVVEGLRLGLTANSRSGRCPVTSRTVSAPCSVRQWIVGTRPRRCVGVEPNGEESSLGKAMRLVQLQPLLDATKADTDEMSLVNRFGIQQSELTEFGENGNVARLKLQSGGHSGSPCQMFSSGLSSGGSV